MRAALRPPRLPPAVWRWNLRGRDRPDPPSRIGDAAGLSKALSLDGEHGGPPTDEITPRSTQTVIHDLIAGATKTLLLVSYASYGVADLADNLCQAAKRGVNITLILESDEDATDHHGPTRPGKLKIAPVLATLGDMIHLYRWTADQRAAVSAPPPASTPRPTSPTPAAPTSPAPTSPTPLSTTTWNSALSSSPPRPPPTPAPVPPTHRRRNPRLGPAKGLRSEFSFEIRDCVSSVG